MVVITGTGPTIAEAQRRRLRGSRTGHGDPECSLPPGYRRQAHRGAISPKVERLGLLDPRLTSGQEAGGAASLGR